MLINSLMMLESIKLGHDRDSSRRNSQIFLRIRDGKKTSRSELASRSINDRVTSSV